MNKKIVILSLMFMSTLVFSQKKVSAKPKVLTEDQKLSYYIGVNVANEAKKQNLNLDVNLLAQALRESKTGGKTLLPIDSMQSFMKQYFGKIQEKKMAEAKLKAQENIKKGQEFLNKNSQNPNVKSTASGMQYEILQEGDKTNYPKAENTVKVKYLGKLIDGTVFDGTETNNAGNPIEFGLNGVIKGWTEGVQLMSKGSKFRFYIPSNLAYGDNGAGEKILPGSLLIFDIELVDFK